ncbi:bacillithiol biosynthesis cysteine-adding enzyme BshC [Salicibibacter halophilus]|uniref:Putative cysteine ligase BshC n=1 Tax=Salicibibacter halophilus TaxID=2502791 RepID=A0A514LFH8_9BACI|nr:bacillithiol biosynthesis cysteine-adding enzyme BshC [Salicibibacter halophilus]QDI90610.1 bacillithiol biosynthesis cysteine-adding enzyme BshC [Salicibibacter halophilus]
MTVESFPVQLQGWAHRYAQGDPTIRAFYDYPPFGEEERRCRELQNYDFKREHLRNALYQYHKKYEHREKALEQIDKLQDERSVAVVGGQQAGLLTGPIYTVSKALTVLLKAKEEEKNLGVPVIPVFWIAGEDHDWEEVNHIYVHGNDGKLSKIKYEGRTNTGAPVSEQPIDLPAMQRWLHTVFLNYRETPYSRKLHNQLASFAKKSSTVSDFFAEVMLWLFRRQGLVLIDPQQPLFRQLMTDTWTQLIEGNNQVRASFAAGKAKVEQAHDAGAFLEASEDHTHLFYSADGRREKLIVHSDGDLSLQNGQYKMSRTDWALEAKNYPEKFSANVYTRPFVQEKLLPVLTFVAGPGEAAYWSMVGPLFHHFGRRVPPVAPRDHHTYVDRKSEKTMNAETLSVHKVANEGATEYAHDLEGKTRQLDTENLFQKSLAVAGEGQQMLANALYELAPSEEKYADKNYQRLQQVLKELQERIEQKQLEAIKPRVDNVKQLEKRLFPNAQPQERVLNIMQFLNEYGEERVLSLFEQTESETFSHRFMYF